MAGNRRLGDGGPAASTLLENLNGVAVDLAANLSLADTTYHRILKLTANNDITFLAGNGLLLSLATTGNVYIGESNNYRVSKVSTS